MTTLLAALALAGLLAALVMLGLLLRRESRPVDAELKAQFELLARLQERTERALLDAIAQSRQEASDHARAQREEVRQVLLQSNDALVQAVDRISTAQQKRLDDFGVRLEALREASAVAATRLRGELTSALEAFREALRAQLADAGGQQRLNFDSFGASIQRLTEAHEKKSDVLREAVDTRLAQIQSDNAAKLEEMRKTVDEKLQGTLEKRLGDSFKLVSDRLEQVHKGLGEMQTLATGVGDLKRVLTNVKTRGTWSEVQLGNLLEQILTAEQFERNVKTRPDSREVVEFAVRLPGRDADARTVVWLPIDAKFPKEDYERLVDAAERSDAGAVELAAKELETRIRAQARDIRDKYLCPPHTTDFGILYLPTEGLYAEVIRRAGLAEALSRDRVLVVGPTTLAALLNSLQMGFRTLAIQQRSSEVWKVLGAVKAEFGKFGDTLEKVKRKLDETGSSIDAAAQRSRVLERKLRSVEALPTAEAAAVLGDVAPDPDPEPAPDASSTRGK